MDSAKPYDPALRFLDCAGCAAPLRIEPNAAKVECGYCGRSAVVRERALPRAARSHIDESVRLTLLHAQVNQPSPTVPRAFDVLPLPPELRAIWDEVFMPPWKGRVFRWVELEE